MRIFIAQLNPIIADITGNTEKIIAALSKAKASKAEIVLFSELILTGYPPQDFLLLPHFIQAVEQALERVIEATDGIIAIVGTIRRGGIEKKLYNSGAVIQNRRLLGFQDKILLPTYDIFDERRYFEPGEKCQPWELAGKRVAITICEDIWQHSHLVKETSYKCDPVKDLQGQHLDLLLNLSASPYNIKKHEERVRVVSQAAKTLKVPACLCNQVGANDSVIFDGRSLCCDQEGGVMYVGTAFHEELFLWDTEKQESIHEEINQEKELFDALVLGVKDYFVKQGFKKACIGLSGGIDSAVVLCLAAEALGADNVLAVAMPSRYSSPDSLTDAKLLAAHLGVRLEEVSIEKPYQVFLDLLEPYFEGKSFDSTEENLQARVRGMILMAFSNKHGYIVLSTGNKSELAMGYSTLYGDLCGGLAVISDITKQQVYALARWVNRDHEVIPMAIIQKEPSAELRPNQKDSDSLPPYEIIDQVVKLYVEEHRSPGYIAATIGVDESLVEGLIKKIHMNEYKRRQSPPGLRISEKAFTVGRESPIVQRWIK